jgi:hypothetical protein
MLEAVAAEDWERLAALEQERATQIEAMEPTVESRSQIAQLKHLNDELVARVTAARDDHRTRLSELERGRSATEAYAATP